MHTGVWVHVPVGIKEQHDSRATLRLEYSAEPQLDCSPKPQLDSAHGFGHGIPLLRMQYGPWTQTFPNVVDSIGCVRILVMIIVGVGIIDGKIKGT